MSSEWCFVREGVFFRVLQQESGWEFNLFTSLLEYEMSSAMLLTSECFESERDYYYYHCDNIVEAQLIRVVSCDEAYRSTVFYS